MNVTATSAPKSTVVLEIELPADRLKRAVDHAVVHLARRTKIPGFRPGKAPRNVLERALGPGAVLDDAVDHLLQEAYREALIDQKILPLTNADVEVIQAEEGKPVIFKATVQVRPEVTVGDYREFGFRPEIEAIDEPKIDKVVEELRDQNATLSPVEGRGAADGDYAVIAFEGTRDGTPFDGGSSERMPLVIGQERLIPGFEAHLVGLAVGDSTEFDITFPADYGEASLAGQDAHFSVTLKELREKIPPVADDEFAQSMGPFADMATLRAEIGTRLAGSAIDRARHEFSDKVIEYAVANATLELPDVLVDQEVEVMHDEFRASLGRQGIDEEAYLKVVQKTEDDLHGEFRPGAEHRAKVLLVLGKIAEVEGIVVPEADVEAEVDKARQRYASEKKLLGYFESDRGRNFIRSTLRRSRLVEKLIDDWLVAHPEHPALPHLEDQHGASVDAGIAEANAATDPSAIYEDEPAVAAERGEPAHAGRGEPAHAEPAG